MKQILKKAMMSFVRIRQSVLLPLKRSRIGRRLAAGLLCFGMMFSLAGCGQSGTDLSSSKTDSQSALEDTSGSVSSIVDAVPNPQTYFGEATAIVDGETSCMFVYRFNNIDKETRSQKFIDFIYFVNVLEKDYGLQLSDKSMEDNYFRFYLVADDSLQRLPEYQNSCHAYLCATWDSSSEENPDSFDFIIIYSSDLTVEDFEPSETAQDNTTQNDDTAASSSEQASSSIQSVDPNSAALPDLGIFLQCGRGEDMSAYGGKLVSYSFDLDEGESAIESVLSLMLEPQYQLKLDRREELDFTSTSAMLSEHYYYNYTGSASVGQVSPVTYDTCQLCLGVTHYYSEGRIGMTLYFGSGFTLIDPGKQLENPPTDFSGNPVNGSTVSSGDTDPNIPDFARPDCSICHGSGDCQVCGGDGYLWSSATGEENRNCWKCHNHDGKCTYCNGTGKR